MKVTKHVIKPPHVMDYNTSKGLLLFPEYGRNIQAMIVLAKQEPDLEKRQLMVESIIQLMYQMNPQSKNVDDYKDKLWKHMFHIADYNLGGVLPPNGIHPTLEDNVKKPETLGYPMSGARFRHYGNNVHLLIKKALAMEEGYIRDGMIGTIGAYMKLAYRTWNKDHYVSDDVIKNDLETLSNGQLSLDEDQKIDRLAAANKRRRDMGGATGGRDNNSRGFSRDNNNSGGRSNNSGSGRDDRRTGGTGGGRDNNGRSGSGTGGSRDNNSRGFGRDSNNNNRGGSGGYSNNRNNNNGR